MRLISLNVAHPRIAPYKGQTVSTGIFKEPVNGPVLLRKLNLEGDSQADLTVHGGPFKAVYAYPSEHYPFWREQFPDVTLPPGMFGENFTTEGLYESDLHIGDVLRIGTAHIMVRQTRTPCYKLALKFQRDDMLARFLQSERSGFYFSVEEEGTVRVGDTFEFVSRSPEGLTIHEMNTMLAKDRYNRTLLDKALSTPAMPQHWHDYFSERLAAVRR